MHKKVLITGASGGLGSTTALKFAESGYDVILNYNENKTLAESLKNKITTEYNVEVLLVKADISQEKEVKEMIDIIKDTWGTIDCLVNNAGISKDNSLEEKNASEFMKVISVNLLGTYLVTKYSLEILKRGVIVNVASTNGIDTEYIESIDYDASKAGVISLTHNFAKYLAPKIRVNAVAPGWIKTDMTSNCFPDFLNKEKEKICLKRFAEPEEIARVILFLASADASYINDAIIRVDGGKNEL